MAKGSDSEAVLREADIQAIRACLDRLTTDAESCGLPLTANLIGAASRAITDEIVERRMQKAVWTKTKN